MRLSPELAALLADAGAPDLRGGPGRYSVVVVKNHGSVPPVVEASGDFTWNRGFDLMIVTGGATSHFCKCRPADDLVLEHETDMLTRMGRDPILADIIPKTRGARSRLIRVQVNRYRPGRLYSTQAPALTLPRWMASMEAILETAELVCARARIAIPELSRGGPTVDVSVAAEPSLSYLSQDLLTAAQAEALHGVLAVAGALPRRPQHGDLWPANIVRGRVYQLLDFEMFGRFQVPLYDACHLVRTGLDVRALRPHPGSRTWLDAMADDDEVASAARRLIAGAAERAGLTASQAIGAVVFYVVEMAAQLHHRRGLQAHWGPFVSEARRVADAAMAGALLDWVFLGHC